MKTVLITGGTGLIGQPLSSLLQQQGFTVLHLSRRANKNSIFPAYHWDVEQQTIDVEALERADAIIHLAGAGIADKRWSENRKREILDSRVKGTELLVTQLKKINKRPEVFVSGSAIGYYGSTGDAMITEKSSMGSDFMAKVCDAWEDAALPLRDWGVRLPILRIGIVLSKNGGALAKMLPSYRFRLGTYFGKGSQYYSWVHIDDICRSLLFLLQQPKADGIFNGAAPNPITNYELAKEIARALGRRALVLPAPEWALRLALGEMADVVLNGTRVLPDALTTAGFQFQYPNIQGALKQLLAKG